MNTIKLVIRNICYNMKYVLTHNLYNENDKQKLEMLDIVEWNLRKRESTGLTILNQEQTLSLLLNKPKSFCRFGDGEMNIMEGKSIPFQKYDAKLAEYFKEILANNHPDMYVGINYYYYHEFNLFNEFNSSFYKLYSYKYGKFFDEKCNKENIYIDAGFNQIYQLYKNYDFEAYYKKVKKLFEKKKVIVFSGNGVLTKLQYDLFEEAQEVIHEVGPSRDAFDEFEELFHRALKYEKNDLLCFILGPVSKALVYELSQKGYCAWDIGHLAKDYNSYMMQEERTIDNMQKFYEPD